MHTKVMIESKYSGATDVIHTYCSKITRCLESNTHL